MTKKYFFLFFIAIFLASGCNSHHKNAPKKTPVEVTKVKGTFVVALRGTNIRDISKITGIPKKQILKWNPNLHLFHGFFTQDTSIYLITDKMHLDKLVALMMGKKSMVSVLGDNVVGIIRHKVRVNDSLPKLIRIYPTDLNLLEEINTPDKLTGMIPDTTILIPIVYKRKNVKTTTKFIKYRVRRGDTGYLIAKRFHISLKQLRFFNPDINFSKLRIGMILLIPKKDTH